MGDRAASSVRTEAPPSLDEIEQLADRVASHRVSSGALLVTDPGVTEVSLEEILRTTEAYFQLLENDPVLVQLLTRAELEQDLGCSQYDEKRLAPFVARMRAAQEAGLLRTDVPPAHLLLIIINAITQWFEARAMFCSWSELDSDDMDAAYLESFHKVFMEGAAARNEKERST